MDTEDRDPTEEEIKAFVDAFEQTFYTEHKEYNPNIPLKNQSQRIRDEVWAKTAAWLG